MMMIDLELSVSCPYSWISIDFQRIHIKVKDGLIISVV
jgi:hypothetical protein